ncbi:MAG: family 2 glycosyl transferase, partial [Saccharothrix sp.]|nr:family 2 glycosyl transferase [Saccharothrix sp.]
MPRPGPSEPRAEGVTVVMSVERDPGDLTAAVDDLMSTLDRIGERHRVLLVLAEDSPVTVGTVAGGLADRYPDRVKAVHHEPDRGAEAAPRPGLAAILAETDHRPIVLTDSGFAAAQLPTLLAAAREERADLVVGYRRDHVDAPRRP